MTAEILYYLPFFLGVVFFIIAREYKDFTIGLLSGITFFVYGVAIIIDPLPELSALSSTMIGVVSWSVGAYIMLRASIEKLKGYD